MSKHETSNQFNNGLMMDVHPLQTPNTVLTDCLKKLLNVPLWNLKTMKVTKANGNIMTSRVLPKEKITPIVKLKYNVFLLTKTVINDIILLVICDCEEK